jgi:predicted amidohydrolase
VLLHRDKTIKRGVELMGEAAAGGARFVSFPETWLPGYPEWVWRLRPGDDYELTGKIHGRLLENAVDLKAGHLKPIQAAARRLKQTVSIGVHERDSEFSRGTLYNPRAARDRDAGGQGRLVDLLGELHAAGALQPVCAGVRGVCRPDVGCR